MSRGRPKRQPSSAGIGLLAAMAGIAAPMTFIGGRSGSYHKRKRNPPGHKLAKRIKMMCGGR